MWIFILVFVTVLVGAGIFLGMEKVRAIREARAAYQASLAELKKAPTDANLRQGTLALGRAYSNLTRNDKGDPLFDEVALMNDITAACAAAAIPPNMTGTVQHPSIEDRLRSLEDLHTKGLITQVEYQSRRSEVLASI